MEKKIKIAFLGVVLVGLIVGGVALAEPPTMPHRFYGNVTINDVADLSGWQILAKIDGQQVAIANIVNGYYDFNVPGEAGETVSFYIKETGKDTLYGTTVTPPTFIAGEITNLNLGVTITCQYGGWQNIGCGQGGCLATQMRQKQTLIGSTPGCDAEKFQCVANSSCGVCNPATVANGTIAAYPSCAITCNSGYYLSGTTCVYSGGGGGGGGGSSTPRSDTTAPSISNIKVVTYSNKAVITWTTNESSISWVVYGITTAYGKEVKTTTYTTSHSVTLSDLSPATTYHYQVKSKDSSGNIGYFADKTFTTLAEGEITSPTESKETSLPFTIEKPLNQMNKRELLIVLLRLIIYLMSQGRATV